MDLANRQIRIIIDNLEFYADLNDTYTADQIFEHLPFHASAITWGQEIYFTLPLSIPEDKNAREILVPGELAFWPVGNAFCIFFGPTPVSSDERPRAYTAVNVFGKITGDLSSLSTIKSGASVRVESLLQDNKNHH